MVHQSSISPSLLLVLSLRQPSTHMVLSSYRYLITQAGIDEKEREEERELVRQRQREEAGDVVQREEAGDVVAGWGCLLNGRMCIIHIFYALVPEPTASIRRPPLFR